MKIIVQAYESNCTSRKKIIQLGIMRLNILISLKSLMKVFMEIRQFREVNHYTNSYIKLCKIISHYTSCYAIHHVNNYVGYFEQHYVSQ